MKELSPLLSLSRSSVSLDVRRFVERDSQNEFGFGLEAVWDGVLVAFGLEAVHDQVSSFSLLPRDRKNEPMVMEILSASRTIPFVLWLCSLRQSASFLSPANNRAVVFQASEKDPV